MNAFFRSLIAIVVSVGVGVLVFSAPMVSAATIGEGGAPGGVNAAKGTGVPTNLASGDGSLIQKIINLMLYAIGVISVIMLIFGGLKYVVSGGKQEAVTTAKNTILYAIVGLLIAVFAYAFIHFILQFILGGSMGGGGTTNV